ncbi:MAG: GNAT family N-acetyltransferase [Candidatus Mcinerneyibacterium aminivorans]|uniref:GNAT family N-acetyltransferase n=1 Tax=Candidatus Mcinerneyibacterium aminivorans TaxID=2703815 RepID=A0A5D0MAE0_9BACT|nr:MAG: GNAT family N-acetyltransferase [Candidatus Mcinerneyibacterium aminivorans]
MKIRKYQHKKDFENCFRIWNECGWVGKDDKEAMELELKKLGGIVAEIDNQVESLVVSTEGDIKYLNENLGLSVVTGVTTSLIARKKGIASKLTAKKLADDADKGMAVSGLTIFEQGFYNKLGFSSIGYHHYLKFTPESLNIRIKNKNYRRFSIDDYKKIHKSKTHRKRLHGSCNLPEVYTRAELKYKSDEILILGFADDNEIKHHICLRGKGKMNKPLNVSWMAYKNYNEFVELLGILKSFEDQIKLISLREPPDIQFQEFLKKPIFHHKLTEEGKYENTIKAFSYYQFRILDLEKCIEAIKIPEVNYSFNLLIEDPIEKYLEDVNSGWKGIGGKYKVHIGEKSFVEKGFDEDLETLETSVNGFTRWWIGAHKPEIIMLTDKFKANNNLIKKLDYTSKFIPEPAPDWGF